MGKLSYIWLCNISCQVVINEKNNRCCVAERKNENYERNWLCFRFSFWPTNVSILDPFHLQISTFCMDKYEKNKRVNRGIPC